MGIQKRLRRRILENVNLICCVDFDVRARKGDEAPELSRAIDDSCLLIFHPQVAHGGAWQTMRKDRECSRPSLANSLRDTDGLLPELTTLSDLQVKLR